MDTQSATGIPLTNPFGNIALAFSGGGFRAAAFSLGSLTYLDHLNLLNKVSFIASTSGGSFTNALYTSYIHKGKTLKDVYSKSIEAMTGQELLKEMFVILENDDNWNKPGNEKHRNFINAFALAYDRLFYEVETFAVYWNKEHVENFEVCFNTTEFFRGLSFRFQTEGTNNPYQVMGNNYLYFDPGQADAIKKIKLADAVAASSCLPAGFEPIIYPQDFSYAKAGESLLVKELKAALLFEDYNEEIHPIAEPFGFMDGGITDNQGLYSVMLADQKRRRRKTPHPFDLIMITDVASYFMDEYKVPEEAIKPAWLTKTINYYISVGKSILRKISSVLKWTLIIAVLVLMAGVATIIFSSEKPALIVAGFICGIAALVITLILLLKSISPVKWALQNKTAIEDDSLLNRTLIKQHFMSEMMLAGLLRFLRISKIAALGQMIMARAMSMKSMLLDINLKQTRRLLYDMFYNDTTWDNRRVPNFIYELSTQNIISRSKRFNSEKRLKWLATAEDKILFLTDCDKLNEVAEESRTMGTTMWFDDNEVKTERLKKIIATGQFTTCCNLLEYIISLERKRVPFEENISIQLQNIKKKLTEDFLHFKSDPYYLYNSLAI